MIGKLDTNQVNNLLCSQSIGRLACTDGEQPYIVPISFSYEHPELSGKRMISFFAEEFSGKKICIENHRIPNVNFFKNNVALVFGGLENIQFKSICRISETCFLIATNQGIVKITQRPAFSKRIDDFSILQGKQMIVRRRIIEHNDKRYYLGFPFILVEDNHSISRFTTQTLTTYEGIVFKDELFCTTEGNGLISIDFNTKKIRAHSCASMASNETFESITKYSDSLLLVAGGNKLVLYDPLRKKGFSYFLKQGTVIHVVVPVKNTNSVYLGTNKGLVCVRMNSRSGFESNTSKESLTCDIRDLILRTHTNELWAATNQGVFIFDMKTLKLRHKYANTQELSHPKVVQLIEDKKGNIWASTYSGLTMFDPKSGTIRLFDKNQGLINTEYNYKSACLLRNGQIIFGGLNAFEIINPETTEEYKYSKKIIISGIETIRNENDKRFSNYQIGQTIPFNTGKEAIKVYITNLDLDFGYGYSFQYSLDGKNWFKTDKKYWFLLSNLSYGDYTLYIRMYNPFSQLVDEKSFPLSVLAPFYVKTSFFIFIVCLVILLSALVVLYFFRSLRIKAKTRAKIAMDLHDESGTILTRLLMMSKRKHLNGTEMERLQIGLKEALYSFRTYLDSLSRQKCALNDLNDELREFVFSSCEPMKIEVEFQVETDLNYPLRVELFRDIKLSIYEIVTNCIKHSRADQISLKIIAKNKVLNIQITDNGICNINELELLKGNGIRNIRKRINRNKGRYTYYIAKGSEGLTIEIQVPL